jgi:hypothetical protein
MRPTNEQIAKLKARLPLGGIKRIVDELQAQGVDFNVSDPYQVARRTMAGEIGHIKRVRECWDERHDAIIRKACEIAHVTLDELK